jgi:hypothetical protein
MNTPFWFQLIHSWCFEKHFTGLTLPFIVGADARRMASSPSPADVKRLLDEMTSYESHGSILVVRWCFLRSTYVFGLIPSAGGRLQIDPQIADTESKIQRVLNEISKSSESLVGARLYSRYGNPARWSDFTDDELKFIDSVIDRSK